MLLWRNSDTKWSTFIQFVCGRRSASVAINLAQGWLTFISFALLTTAGHLIQLKCSIRRVKRLPEMRRPNTYLVTQPSSLGLFLFLVGSGASQGMKLLSRKLKVKGASFDTDLLTWIRVLIIQYDIRELKGERFWGSDEVSHWDTSENELDRRSWHPDSSCIELLDEFFWIQFLPIHFYVYLRQVYRESKEKVIYRWVGFVSIMK